MATSQAIPLMKNLRMPATSNVKLKEVEMIMLMILSQKESLVHRRRRPKSFPSLATLVSGKKTIATGNTYHLLNHSTNATPAKTPSKERICKISMSGNRVQGLTVCQNSTASPIKTSTLSRSVPQQTSPWCILELPMLRPGLGGSASLASARSIL